MRKLLTGECHDDNIFEQLDPTGFREAEFEAEVVKALTCLLPEYWCGVFSGSFVLENERKNADLALIHKNMSHWFVVEVELAGHSFEHHVLPQVRCFRFGEPESTCITSLVRAFPDLERGKAETLLRHVPRCVAVVDNIPNHLWRSSLSALDVQYLTLSIYTDRNGRTAHEVEGRLVARDTSLGFATFSSTDNSLLLPKSCGLPMGPVQITDQFGTSSTWTIRGEAGNLWMTKNRGPALLDHRSYVHLIRTFDGRICLRPSLT